MSRYPGTVVDDESCQPLLLMAMHHAGLRGVDRETAVVDDARNRPQCTRGVEVVAGDREVVAVSGVAQAVGVGIACDTSIHLCESEIREMR